MLGACTTASFTTGHRRPPAASAWRESALLPDGLIEVRRRDIRESFTAFAETLQRSRPGLSGGYRPGEPSRQEAYVVLPRSTVQGALDGRARLFGRAGRLTGRIPRVATKNPRAAF